MKVDGQCHCGAISFEAEVDPEMARACHCSDCQTLSGTAFRVVVPVAEANFRMLSGDPKVYVKLGDSGARRAQAFCGDCGAPIYATAADGDGPRIYGLRVGAIRQRDQLPPKAHIWHRSAQAWLGDLPSLPAQDKQ